MLINCALVGHCTKHIRTVYLRKLGNRIRKIKTIYHVFRQIFNK